MRMGSVVLCTSARECCLCPASTMHEESVVTSVHLSGPLETAPPVERIYVRCPLRLSAV